MALRMVLMMAVASTIGLVASPQALAAGFFDDLARVVFGGGRPTPPVAIGDPFEMTVKQKRQRPRAAEVTKPAEPAVKLDPVKDPYWYLNDPTLRKGDIVVTSRGVVVFDGRSSSQHSPAAFATLDETKRLPKTQAQVLQAAAAGGRAYFSTPAIGAMTEVHEAKADIGATAQAQ